MKGRRLLAFFLSMLLILSVMTPTAYAEELDPNASNQLSQVQDVETVPEENVDIEAETPDVSEEESVPAETENSVSDETTEETVPSTPAQDFSGEANGVNVTVNAPEGAFPSDTVMTVSEADENSVQAAADAAGTEVEDVKAVEITFTAGEEEVEPAVPVKVTLAADMIADAEEPVVVHVDDDNKAEVISDTTVEDGTVVFEADAFSAYALAVQAEKEEETAALAETQEDENTNYVVSINYVFEDNTQAAQTWSASLAKSRVLWTSAFHKITPCSN